MDKLPITETLAINLAYFMKQTGIAQGALAKSCRLGQTTISLYLNPDKRKPSATGKESSPTLARVSLLAEALGVELWELVCPLSPAERGLLRSLNAVIAEQTPAASQKALPERKPTPKRVRRASTPAQAKRRRA